VLLTARTLTATELDRIHMHSSLGHAVLFGIDGMQRVAEAVLHHHEYKDGSGYHGKRGAEISRLAQIFIAVDAYESMLRTDRLFREGVAHEAAIAELTSLRGARYEADVIDALLAIDVHEWRAVSDRFAVEARELAA
jgi:HD-GYP domain-containing protein (c-di-GMP phosphodiesterase class II)